MKPDQIHPFRGMAASVAVVIVGLAAAGLEAASLVTVTSSNFSLAYGATVSTANPTPGTWTTAETAGTNTPTTQSSFSFTPTVTGRILSNTGITFVNRVLGNGAYDVGVSGWSNTFNVNLAGAYSGSLPLDAFDPQITLVVSSISLYGLKIHLFGTNSMQFQETTAGHTSSSSTIILNDVSPAQNPPPTPFAVTTNWKQLVWNPNDFAVAGTSSLRTFNLGTFTSTQGYGIDGLVIDGYVIQSYLVPEPISAVMLGIAGAVVMLSRRKVAGR